MCRIGFTQSTQRSSERKDFYRCAAASQRTLRETAKLNSEQEVQVSNSSTGRIKTTEV
jgi:hypothetical protein